MQKKPEKEVFFQKKRRTIFDVNYLWELFVRHKKWFALSVVICLGLAGAYIYFSRPAYSVLGKMAIIERRQSSSAVSASMALMNQLPLGLGSSLNLGRSLGSENEKEILKTKSLAKDVVTELGLYTEYRLQKTLKSRLLYKTQPVSVTVSDSLFKKLNDGLPLTVYRISLTIDKNEKGYTVSGEISRNGKKRDLDEQSFKAFPAVFHTELGDLKLSANQQLTAEQRKPYQKDYRLKVSIAPPMVVAKRFTKRMSVGSASKKATSIIHISLNDESIVRGIDFINNLVEQYNRRSNEDRREEATKNDEYVSERLEKIDRELGTSDSDWEKVKRQYQVTDPKVDAQEVMEKKSVYENQLVSIGIQKQLLDYLTEYVTSPSNLYELIPASFGMSASENSSNQQNVFKSGAYTGDAVSIIRQHNALVTERRELLKSISEKSPRIQQIDQLIKELHPTVLTALQRDRQTLTIRQRAVEQEYNRYMSRVGEVPEQERILTEVSRLRSIKQGVYISLLQKREDIAMELANNTEKGRLIDETQMVKKQKPKTMLSLLLAPVIGLLIPYLFLLGRRGLRTTVGEYEDLKVQTPLPVIGYIPKESTQTEEAFYSIRSVLLHLMKEEKKVMLITSDATGDGKTYVATHLAQALSQTGKKVVLCDLDFRHPSIAHILKLVDKGGMGELLAKNMLTQEVVSESINSSLTIGFDVLGAGITKGHPANLMACDRLKQIILFLRERYDYVLLDTSAIGECDDALVGGISDITCYVCCSGKTPKSALNRLEQLAATDRIALPCVIMNEV